jgi:hypothetical protein
MGPHAATWIVIALNWPLLLLVIAVMMRMIALAVVVEVVVA